MAARLDFSSSTLLLEGREGTSRSAALYGTHRQIGVAKAGIIVRKLEYAWRQEYRWHLQSQATDAFCNIRSGR